MSNTTKNLWKMKRDHFSHKFFKWMWGINPVTHYKTACPYYWQYFGSIIILPSIILFKLIKYIIHPIQEALDAHTTIAANAILDELKLKIKNAKDNKDYWDLINHKCFQKYKYEITSGHTDLMSIMFKADAYDDILREKKLERQVKIDNFKYGKVGTTITYVITAAVVLLIGWGIYELLHLFTWSEFVQFSIKLFIALIVMGVAGVIWFILTKISKSTRCNSWLHKLVIWKYIGMFFVAIWTGLLMFIDMIKNIYTKSCPRIDWE